MNTYRTAQVTAIVGGQRLFIVPALIPNPEVVFLDELTTGLDGCKGTPGSLENTVVSQRKRGNDSSDLPFYV